MFFCVFCWPMKKHVFCFLLARGGERSLRVTPLFAPNLRVMCTGSVGVLVRHTFLPPRDVRDHGGRRPAGPHGQTSCSWWCCCWIGVIGTFERLHSATNVERLADCVCVCVAGVELKFSVCDLPSVSSSHTLVDVARARAHGGQSHHRGLERDGVCDAAYWPRV
jgi:hypothetical protein